MDTNKLKQIGLSYFRAAAAVAAGLYMSGQHDPKMLVNAFIAGLVGPILKALDSSAKEFGKGSTN
jgi:hypothetical protein